MSSDFIQLKISDLPEAVKLTGNELLELTQYDQSVRIKVADIISSGKSAYDLAVMAGFRGTLEDWIVSFKGTPGAHGLKGDPGEPGTRGPQGPQGPTGPRGEGGPAGPRGEMGAQGPIGMPGARGISGLPGTTGATGALGATGAMGPIGPQGPQGAKGEVGSTGAQGAKGDTGSQGVAGPTGAQGLLGETGAQGLQGSRGETGLQGMKGNQGDTGATGAQGPQGDKGDLGLTGPRGLQGEVGPQGNPGTNGQNGAAGAKGTDGTIGATGPAGPVGPAGIQGVRGDTGATGPTGPQGVAGPTGAAGAQGVAGPTGSKGDTGLTGATGSAGAQGATGPQGIQGVRGDAGTAGATGAQGPAGTQGDQGPAGPAGIQGTQGLKGDTGLQGVQGPRGLQGVAGVDGLQGAAGVPGVQGATGSTGPRGAKGADADLSLSTLVHASVSRFNSNPRTRGIYLDGGTLESSVGSAPAEYTRVYPLTSGAMHVLGGAMVPVTTAGLTGQTVQSVTVSSGVRVGTAWRVEFAVTGTSFILSTSTTGIFRVLIGGRYVSTEALSFPGGEGVMRHKFTLPFRKTHSIRVECQADAVIYDVRVTDTDTVFPIKRLTERLLLVGDSNTAATGQAYLHNGLGSVASDFIGISDAWISSVADTGFLANNAAVNYNYRQRSSDWTLPDVDVLVFCASINDIVQGYTPENVKAEVAQVLLLARQAHPHAAIFVLGIPGSREYFSSLSVLDTVINHENAVSDAVNEAMDERIAFIPITSAATPAPLTGVNASTGNWALYTLNDGHLNTDGHRYMGEYIANRLVEAFADMAQMPMPIYALDPLGMGPKGERGQQGYQGIQGIQGIQGVKGDTGNTGATGPQGIQGIQGIQGSQGVQGNTGAQGPTGMSNVVNTTSTALTLVSGNYNKWLRFTNAATKTLTINTSATEFFIDITNRGDGTLTVVAGSGVTIEVPAYGSLLLGKGMSATLKWTTSTSYELMGQTL